MKRGGLFNYKSVRTLNSSEDISNGIGKVNYLINALCHTLNALFSESEAVDHNIGNSALCSIYILFVFGKDVIHIFH